MLEASGMNYRWLEAAFVDWTVIAIAMLAAEAFPWLIPIAWFIVGNRQHALGILGHDGAHQLIAPKHRQWNDLICNLFTFWPLALPLEPYRKFHFDHHRFTNTEQDPEIRLKRIGPCKMEPPFSVFRVVSHSILDLFGFGAPQIAAFLHEVRARTWQDAIAYLFAILATLLLVSSGHWLVAVIWWVSVWTTFWHCFRLRVWSEHIGLGEGETLIFKPNWIQRAWFLPHNTWAHWEHHWWPSMAFNDLGKHPGVQTLCEARHAR